jgi:S1-C subfamily serine protease
LNVYGEVIGVNRAIVSANSDGSIPTSSGIGFAVPVNMVKRVVPSLIQFGSYDYPYLGVRSLTEINLETQKILDLPQATGAYITEVTSGGPCDQAGIRGGSQPTAFADLMAGGDLVVAVDGHPVLVFADLLNYLLETKSPGDTIILTIIRDNQQKEVSVTLGTRS